MNKALRLNIDYSDFIHHIDGLLKDHPNKDALVKFMSNAIWNTDCGAEKFLEFMVTHKQFPELHKPGTFGYVTFDNFWLSPEASKHIKEHKILLEGIYMPCVVTEVTSLASNYPVKIMYICDVSNVTEDGYYDIITDRSSCRLDQFEQAEDERGFKELLLNKL